MRRIVHTLFLLAAVGSYLALTGDLALAAEVRPQWQQEWDKVLEGAKKEGRVVVAAGVTVEPVFPEFQKKYPEIKLVSIGRGEQAARIVPERRAGKYLVDVVFVGGSSAYNLLEAKALDPIKPALILPEVLDESKWWKGKHLYMDDEGKYIFAFNLTPQLSWAYNTKLVDPNGIKSYWDFLHPKWKGRILLLDQPLLGLGRPCSSFTNTPSLDLSLFAGF